jgi:hypothetical protein
LDNRGGRDPCGQPCAVDALPSAHDASKRNEKQHVCHDGTTRVALTSIALQKLRFWKREILDAALR